MKCRHYTTQQIKDAIILAGSPSAAAHKLGIPRTTLYDRIKKDEIDVAHLLRTHALQGLGLHEKDAEAAVMQSLEVSGTSRYYSLEDGGIWVKTDKAKQKQDEILAAMKEELLRDVPKVKGIKPARKVNESLAVVIPIGDAHVGMYAWADEAGEQWDLEIAEQTICSAFKYLIDQTPAAEKCIIANVGDFFHYNGMKAKTDTHGHILDAAGRPQEMRRVGMRILRYCIEYAATKHKVVESINAPGNHDDTTMHIFNMALANIYENSPNIIIHDAPTTRHYTQHGQCLFGVVHGHQTKDADLPVTMATERAKEWGETKHRVWFRGHHHHDSRVEYAGAYVEQVRTLAASDDYAVGGAYLSGRDIKAITYHKDYGEVGRVICGIDLLKELLD